MSTISKFLPIPPDNFSTQIATTTVTTSTLSIELDDATDLGIEGVGQLFKKDANGNIIAGTIEFIHWTGKSSNTITLTNTGDRGITGSDSGAQAYSADDYFEVWVSSYYSASYGALSEHNADGTHKPAVIYDTNGNEQIKLTATASAVNEITVTNAATGNAPEISATGGDTNIDLKLKGKGTGQVKVYNPTSTAYEVAIGETGWIPSTYTWTYASASTFTIAGVDLTTVFTKGTKLKFTQTTDKYAVVVSSSFSTDTTVTIAVNTNYVIANAAITNPYFSYIENPRGYPHWFAYTPTFTNLTKGGAAVTFSYARSGNTVFVRGAFVFAADTSVSGIIGVSLPITAATANQEQTFIVRATDTGTNSHQIVAHMATNSRLDFYSLKTDATYLEWLATSSTVPFTWTTNDAFMINFAYEAA